MVKTASTMTKAGRTPRVSYSYANVDSSASKWCERIGWFEAAIGFLGLIVVPVMMANFEELTIPGRDFLKVAVAFYDLRINKWANWNDLPGAYGHLLRSILFSSVCSVIFGVTLVIGTCKEKGFVLQIWSFMKIIQLGTVTWQILKATFYSGFGIEMIGIMVQVPIMFIILTIVEVRINEVIEVRAAAEPSGSNKV